MNRIAAYLNVTKPRIARTNIEHQVFTNITKTNVAPINVEPAVSKSVSRKSERMLKDIAFVLQLTRRIRDEIENS